MMKKFFATLLCLALVAGLFAACSGSKDNNAKADSKKVGIAVLSENGAFTDMRTPSSPCRSRLPRWSRFPWL